MKRLDRLAADGACEAPQETSKGKPSKWSTTGTCHERQAHGRVARSVFDTYRVDGSIWSELQPPKHLRSKTKAQRQPNIMDFPNVAVGRTRQLDWRAATLRTSPVGRAHSAA